MRWGGSGGSSTSSSLAKAFGSRGFDVVWARAPITVDDIALPGNVTPISVYPLVRYLRAFDVFAGAAGYNTCCEVIQSGVPSLLVPNALVADDQARRAVLTFRALTRVESGAMQMLYLADQYFEAGNEEEAEGVFPR